MKTALVTGGSRGIGAAVVRALRADGYVTAFFYEKREEAAQSLAAECGAIPVRCDVRSSQSVNDAVHAFLAEYRHLDVLVNNAGVSYVGLLQDMSDADWNQVLDVNLSGAFRCCRAVLPAMIRRKSGRIIQISSVWGRVGASCEAAYSASKAGLIGLTLALAKEAGPSGVTVNCVCPGVIRTDMLNRYSEADLTVLSEETPLGRLGTPEDVAKCVLSLCGEAGAFLTGQVIGVDGGFGL